MKKKITIYDIAKKLNITAATVSRALNDNPKISPKTRELVKATAEKMNYEQNRLALALKSGKSNTIGVIVPRIDRDFFATIIKGIEDELHPYGYHIIICQTYDLKEREIENITTLLNAQVDGILMSISNSMTEISELKRILNKNVPLIFFDRKREMEGVSTVTINDFEGGYEATKHLIDIGCKKVAHLTVDRSLEIYKLRFEGYKQALLDNGLEFNPEYVLEVENNYASGKSTVEKLMNLDTPPDAVFSSSDYIALGVIQGLRSMGYKLPEDFCVVGFSNEPFTKYMELSISSVEQFPLEMGKTTAKVFLEQVNNNNGAIIEKKVVLKPKLHIRMSSSKG